MRAEDDGFLKLYYIMNREYILLLLSTEDPTMQSIEKLIDDRKFTLRQIEKLLGLHSEIDVEVRFLRDWPYMFGHRNISLSFVEQEKVEHPQNDALFRDDPIRRQ